jgi:hypothetical protein
MPPSFSPFKPLIHSKERFLILISLMMTLLVLGPILGFGDSTPLTKVAKSFFALEAIIGQLHFVVVVAWFVGMLVARKSGQKDSEIVDLLIGQIVKGFNHF